ncbi:MAG: efflux RND transporter periplasmic adaptor subunit [Thiotrichales bacterium]|nr:efflux RND transporter periplasmic adaptor subunit [Thiotrichales bacterium]
MLTKPFFLVALLSLSTLSSFAYAASTQVIAYKVTNQTQENTLFTLGSLRAFQSTHLAAPVSERVRTIHITDGQMVNKGEILFEFNDAEEQALLKQVQLEVIETRRQHQRLLDIKDSSLVTQAQIDEKYTAWQTALAKQKNIQVQIDDRKVLAPFKGQLGFSDISVGNQIETGDVLVSLDDVDVMKLDVLVPARYLSDIKLNQTISAKSEAYPNTDFKGRIVAIAPQLEAQSRMVQVRAHIDNNERKLKTNMMVKAQINLSEKQVLMVPNSAIIMLGDHNYIYRLKEDENNTFKVEKVTIKAGQVGDKYTEIKSGLAENDIVISQGVMRVKPKSIVTIKAFENDLPQEALLKASSKKNNSTEQKPGN